MKKAMFALTLAAVLAGAAFFALPATATVDSGSDLARLVAGGDGMATRRSGCTRVTNRFCVLDTRDNCSACR
jgi:hypothetical protein